MHCLRRIAVLALLLAPLGAQVHYHEDGRPWKQRAKRGPDAEVPGWFYNLGTTGLRVELSKERPKQLLVRHVLAGSPAARKIRAGDWILGAGKKRFKEDHVNGYGMDKFGPKGPIEAFAAAIDRTRDDKGKLLLLVEREGETATVKLDLKIGHEAIDRGWPRETKVAERTRERLFAELIETQREDGSWGHVVPNTFAPLALMAAEGAKAKKAVSRAARFHARTTDSEDSSWLINWRYCAAAIVLAEYHHRTQARWVKQELTQIRDFLLSSQYTDRSQIHPETKKKRKEDLPRDAMDSHGGWGHNPGFEGYGPIAMITGQAALALSLIERAGIEVPRERVEAAYAFLERGTGRNGYVWYGDEVAGHERWADMGRTGAAGLAHALATPQTAHHRTFARRHAEVMGQHPLSFPDTHGSPLMGMGYGAAAAWQDEKAFASVMRANRWWFTLARCPDGTFHYQPNRDNAGYGDNARLKATATVAFILTIPDQKLQITSRGHQ